MTAYRRAEGKTVNYTPVADVAAGLMVNLDSKLVGVAENAIPANVKGALTISGIFEMPYDAGSAPDTDLGGLNSIDFTTQEIAPTGTTAGIDVYSAGEHDATADTLWAFLNNPG